MSVLDLVGWADLVYLPPNHWEKSPRSKLRIYVIWSDGINWNSLFICDIKRGDHKILESSELPRECLISGVAFAYVTSKELSGKMKALPTENLWKSDIPEWRASSGFRNNYCQTSYQAEVVPLPPKASMLSFHPFIQYGPVSNYLLLLNLKSDPSIVSSKLTIYSTRSTRILLETEIQANSATLVPLDPLNIPRNELPVIESKNLAAIPFGVGISHDERQISMEHTHPPASLTIYGNRRVIQGKIKSSWSEYLSRGTVDEN
jgi:hypothetical protein